MFKRVANLLLNRRPQNPHSYKSYSQCGEDLIIQYLFALRGIHHPSYIDIGAHHPFFLSNTALFYEKGSRGINIDANPQLMQRFISNRNEDVNLNIGIGDKVGELDFFIMKDSTLSTFSREECDHLKAGGKELAEIKKIHVTTLSQVLADHNEGIFPDFLNLDVEGLDHKILRSADFTVSSPKVICVEAAEYSSTGAGARRNELIDLLVERGYYEYANTNLNAIMVKKDFWFI